MTKIAPKDEIKQPFDIIDGMIFLRKIVKDNVPLITLRMLDDGKRLSVTTFGRPIGEFISMTFSVPVGRFKLKGLTDGKPVVVSMPMLLAALGIGRSNNRPKDTGEKASLGALALDTEGRTLDITGQKSKAKLPLYPYVEEDDNLPAMGSALKAIEAKDGWRTLPMAAIAAGLEVVPNKLKINVDLADAKAASSLVVMPQGKKHSLVAVANQYSCFVGLAEVACPAPVTLSAMTVAMLRSLVTDAGANQIKLAVDKTGAHAIIHSRVIDGLRFAVMLRVPKPSESQPSPEQIAGIWSDARGYISGLSKKRAKARVVAGEARDAMLNASMFANKGDSVATVVITATGSGHLQMAAKKDNRTEGSYRLDVQSGPGPDFEPRAVSADDAILLLSAFPSDAEIILLSPPGTSYLLAAEIDKEVVSAALLVGRSIPQG